MNVIHDEIDHLTLFGITETDTLIVPIETVELEILKTCGIVLFNVSVNPPLCNLDTVPYVVRVFDNTIAVNVAEFVVDRRKMER